MSLIGSTPGDVVILAGGTGRVGGATLARLIAGGSRVALFSRDRPGGQAFLFSSSLSMASASQGSERENPWP
jgi:uncharacterized protein YbjT (DUF2867 family)